MLRRNKPLIKITIIKNKNKSKYKNWTSQGHFSGDGGHQISIFSQIQNSLHYSRKVGFFPQFYGIFSFECFPYVKYLNSYPPANGF